MVRKRPSSGRVQDLCHAEEIHASDGTLNDHIGVVTGLSLSALSATVFQWVMGACSANYTLRASVAWTVHFATGLPLELLCRAFSFSQLVASFVWKVHRPRQLIQAHPREMHILPRPASNL
jgi:hypothetical protein